VIEGAVVSLTDAGKELNGAAVGFYDPWSNRWTQVAVKENRVSLPDFTRSIVVKMEY
jgi:hypothetical protein